MDWTGTELGNIQVKIIRVDAKKNVESIFFNAKGVINKTKVESDRLGRHQSCNVKVLLSEQNCIFSTNEMIWTMPTNQKLVVMGGGGGGWWWVVVGGDVHVLFMALGPCRSI